jgi:general secretion pathway protein A
MYADYYHLTAMPFQLTPDFQFLFESAEHKRAISHLIYGLTQGEGFIVITGEIGAGKTMLVERLWSEIDQQKFVAVRILTTQISGDDILKMVASGFGLSTEGADKATLLRRLEHFFAEMRAAGKQCLLIVDEAQNLPASALEELRMLSNFAVGGRAPFQCFLLGQPQFRQMLSDPGLEQLQQRVLASYHLGPMIQAETREYVEHRMKTAGWSGDPSFEAAAFGAIHRHSSGIPRRINSLCSRVLLAGYLDEAHCISELIVDSVAEELSRDLVVGRSQSESRFAANAISGQSSDRKIASLERVVNRHDRIIKRALMIAVELVETLK